MRDTDGDVQIIQGCPFQLKIVELDLTRKHTYFQVLLWQSFYVVAQNVHQDIDKQVFRHGVYQGW